MRFLLFVLLVGCTPAADVIEGICGNFIQEGDEECDRPFGCTNCQVACAPFLVDANGVPLRNNDGSKVRPPACEEADAVPGECCPRAAVCGPADLICHEPSGGFTKRSVDAHVRATEFAIDDIDDDDIGDLVGVGNGAVIVHHGSASTPLETETSRTAPFPTAFVSIADVSGDGVVDVMIPSEGGVSLFEGGGATPLEPVSFPFTYDSSNRYVRTGRLPNAREIFRLFGGAAHYSIGGESISTRWERRACSNLVPQSGDKLPGRLFEPRLNPIGAASSVVFVVDRLPKPLVCIETNEQAPANGIPAALELDNFRVSEFGNVFLAQTDIGTACPEVVIPKQSMGGPPQTNIFKGTTTQTPCSMDKVTPPVQLNGAPLVAVRGPTRDLIVTTSGIFDGVIERLSATRAWSVAVAGDFDRDGLEDFAVAGITDDIEVVQQLPPLGSVPQWRIQRIALQEFIRDLATGDFDGDGHGDLAIATIDSSSSKTSIYVSYGSPTGFGEPTLELTFADPVFDLSAADLPDPSIQQPLDHFDEIVVAHNSNTHGKLSFVYGSANRQLSAPWHPDTVAKVRAVGTAVGGFGPGTPGVFALFEGGDVPADCTETDNAQAVHRGPDTFVFDTNVNTCELDKYSSSPRFVSVPFATRELVLGFDAPRTKFTIPGGSGNGEIFPFIPPSPAATCAVFVWLPRTSAEPRFEKLLCGDATEQDDFQSLGGVLDAVVVPRRRQPSVMITSSDMGKVSMNEWVVKETADNRIVLADRKPIDMWVDATAQCIDVAPIELGTKTDETGIEYGKDLDEQVLACIVARGGTRQIDLLVRYLPADQQEKGLFVRIDTLDAQPVFDIETGDVTGDGLPDIIARSGGGGVTKIFENCDTRCAKAKQ